MSKHEQQEAKDGLQHERKGGSGGRGKLLLAGFSGGIVGTIAGLLLAPWRGAETRQKLKETAAAAGRTAKENATAAKEKVGELVRRKMSGKAEEATPGDDGK